MVCGRAGWTALEVHPPPAGSEGPGLQCASPTPTAAQAKTMGACALPPGYRGPGPHQLAPRQPCQPPPPPGTTSARQPGPPRAVPAPGNFNRPQPGARALLGRGWGVPAGSHHSAPPMALHGEVWAEEQVSDGQEQGLGQRPGVLVIVLCLLGTRPPEAPQSWLAEERRPQDLGSRWRTGLAQAGTHSGGREEVGGRRNRQWTPNHPKPPKAEGDSGEQGWEHSGGLPSDWEGPGEPPKLESLSPAENYWAHPPNTTHPQLPGQNPREGVG